MGLVSTVIFGLFAVLAALISVPVYRQLVLGGLTRPLEKIQNVHGLALKIIPNTLQCEDLHLHKPSGLLFTACQTDDVDKRYQWFPPLLRTEDLDEPPRGTLVVVDPKTFKSRHLKLEGFPGPFSTHGIDIYSPPSEPESVYIFAVNHLQNPLYKNGSTDDATRYRARSQVELFHHSLGSPSATHLRSIRHAAIRTPNDIYAVSESEFYVTNDHYYREPSVMRMLEDLGTASTAPWTDTVHIALGLPLKCPDATARVSASIALTGLHTNNGLGRASVHRPREILVADPVGGLYRAARAAPPGPSLRILEHISLPACIDNPSYFDDPFATAAQNASGYILAGLHRAIDLPAAAADRSRRLATSVLHVRQGQGQGAMYGGEEQKHDKWEKRLVFVDNGKTLHSASAAVLVAIDPRMNEGKKQGWLFVTGFMSESMVAAKIDL